MSHLFNIRVVFNGNFVPTFFKYNIGELTMEAITKSINITSAVEHLFDEEIRLIGITEFGVSWDELVSGKAEIPTQGARFNIEFEGKVFGDSINGDIRGIDYLYVRSDGKFELNIQASILTDDGVMIHVQESGSSRIMYEGIAQLNLTLNFSTSSPEYEWINTKQVWGVGLVDMIRGNVSMKCYSN
jgi:predicted  nucleic acid-binding Zn-ribbon protein